MKNSVKWRGFEVSVVVERVNDNLISETAKLNNSAVIEIGMNDDEMIWDEAT
jgi:hypothetical protein